METQVINRKFPKFLIQILITTNLPQTPVKSQKEQANLSGVVLKKQGRDICHLNEMPSLYMSPCSLEVTPRTDTQGQPPGLQSQKVVRKSRSVRGGDESDLGYHMFELLVRYTVSMSGW